MHVSYTACNAASKGATVFTLVCGFDFEDIPSTFSFGLIN